MAILNLDIDDLGVDGDGLATVDKRAIRVPFTIPGERVQVDVTTSAQGTAARLLTVLRASPHRVSPRCRHFGPDAVPGVGPCGGCSWQHIAYPEQLRLKTALLERLIKAAVPKAPTLEPMRSSTPLDHPWGYRHKVHFVFGDQATPATRQPTLVLGHYVRGSRRLVPIQECPVHDERGNRVAFRLRDAYARAGIRAPGGRSGSELRSVAIRVGYHTPELMTTLVVGSDEDRRLRAATRRAIEDAPIGSSFHLNVHPRRDAFIFGPDTRRLRGTARMREEVAGTSFLISPTAFFQTNVAAADLLVTDVLAAVPAKSRVLDLYAGAGLFAIPLSLAGHRVIAIEDNRAAVADGVASARLNKLDATRCRFVVGRVEASLTIGEPIDAVVMDPPREGCSRGVIETVFRRLKPATAVYVSCNPETLARDLRNIVDGGYTIRRIQPLDMFPHTPHIETVVVVTR